MNRTGKLLLIRNRQECNRMWYKSDDNDSAKKLVALTQQSLAGTSPLTASLGVNSESTCIQAEREAEIA
jgi:hypothetical protein